MIGAMILVLALAAAWLAIELDRSEFNAGERGLIDYSLRGHREEGKRCRDCLLDRGKVVYFPTRKQ